MCRKFECRLSPLSDVLPPLRSQVRSLYRTSDRTWEEFVNALPKVVGFLRVLRFPPIGKVDRVVLVIGLTVWKIMRKNCKYR